MSTVCYRPTTHHTARWAVYSDSGKSHVFVEHKGPINPGLIEEFWYCSHSTHYMRRADDLCSHMQAVIAFLGGTQEVVSW